MTDKTEFHELTDQLKRDGTPYKQEITDDELILTVDEPVTTVVKRVYHFTRDGAQKGEPEVLTPEDQAEAAEQAEAEALERAEAEAAAAAKAEKAKSKAKKEESKKEE